MSAVGRKRPVPLGWKADIQPGKLGAARIGEAAVWWKLSGLLVLTAAAIFVIIPIRSRVVIYDPAKDAPSPPYSLWSMVNDMYLTPGTMMPLRSF